MWLISFSKINYVLASIQCQCHYCYCFCWTLTMIFLYFAASLGAISNPIGSILSGFLAEYFGRRRSMQLSSFPFFAGWMCIGLANDIPLLYLGRFITGIAAGKSFRKVKSCKNTKKLIWLMVCRMLCFLKILKRNKE